MDECQKSLGWMQSVFNSPWFQHPVPLEPLCLLLLLL